MWIRTQALATVLALVLAAPAFATPAGTGVTYALVTPPSELEYGCQGPCECPIVATPNFGSFELVPAGSDADFEFFDVPQFIASFNNGPGAVMILGSGRYARSTHAPATQQMQLDLQIEGRPVQHFDSGLVPETAAFPAIEVRAASNDFACLDTVIVVDALPAPTNVAPGTLPPGLRAASPNPFAVSTRIEFAIGRPGPVRLDVCDVAGRRVRRLLDADLRDVGPQSASWDGRRDDGRAAPTGLYWVRLVWPGGADERRVIKLR